MSGRLKDRLNKSQDLKPKKQPAASNAFLWVEDQQYKILEVDYGFKRHADGSGRAVGDVHLQPFIVVIKPLGTMDALVELSWLNTTMFSGRIENYHDDGIHKKHKDTIIHNAYIEDYEIFGNYYEEQEGRIIVLKIAPQYVKIMESDYETSMNPSKPMEMNPKGLLTRASFEPEEKAPENEESKYTLESTYIHDHITDVASDTITEFNNSSTSIAYQFYKKIVDGTIVNPNIRVTKKRVSDLIAYYDESNQEILVWEKNLETIESNTDKKIKLITALANAYGTYINIKLKDQLTIKESLEIHEYDLFRFDGIDNTSISIAKLKSPTYTGDLILDFDETKAAAPSKWVKNGPGQSIFEVHSFENPISQPKGWPPNLGIKFSFSLQGGFSTSIYAGISYQIARTGDTHVLSSLNAALTYYGHGTPGTSVLSPNLVNASLTPSITLGHKTGNALNLNLFNSFTGSGVNVPYEYAFTLGATGILSSGRTTKSYDKHGNRIKDKYNKHDHDHRHQIIGGANIKVGNFMISSYNDIRKPFLFYGMDSDQYWSAGVEVQAKLKHQMHMSYAFDLYYGKSNNKMPYNLDKNSDGQNYDHQKLFNVLLNRGQETFTTTDAVGNSSTQTQFGYGTFWPSNMMHDAIPFPEVPKQPAAPTKPIDDTNKKLNEEYKKAKTQYETDIKEYNEEMINYTISTKLTPHPTFHHLFVVYKNGKKTPDLERLNTYMSSDVSEKSKNLQEFFTLEKKFKKKKT